MNPPPGNRRSFSSQPSVPGLPSRAAPSTTTAEESSRRVGDILRRGHSDGDVLLSGFQSRNSLTRNEFTRDEETWMDFLRHSSNSEQNNEEQVQVASRRVATMAADRKRRFTGQQEEHSRRRSASSLSFGQTTSERIRLSLPQPTSSHPLFGSARATESRLGQRIIDRPLPPRPSISRSPTRQSRDIALPRWQPDAEVTNCPICGAHFSFWYRKHHCRKCGRVVCANCSPHRITIPRQFIVHSPQEADQDLGLGIASSCTVIDLTDEDEGNLGGLHPFNGAERQQRQEQHIDPALGGGQEVRLCNPCVPDPNPLPHVSFASRGRYNFDSFPSPEDMSRVLQQNQGHPNPASSTVQSQNLPSNAESSIQPHRSHSNSTSNLNQERPLPRTTFIGASAPSRRQSHVSRPSGQFPHLPPNYSSIYGSAPDPSFHEVC